MITRRKPLRRVSSKHAKELRLYSKLAKEYKTANPYCEAKISPHCTLHTTDIHHTFPVGQYPKYRLVQSLWLATCRQCHRYLHEHPSEARSKNLLK